MSRLRQIAATGDEGTAHRSAREGIASATVVVGNAAGDQPDQDSPSFTITVDRDGVVQVIGQTSDSTPGRVLITGHVDQLGDAA